MAERNEWPEMEQGVDEILSDYRKFISDRSELLSLLYDVDMLPEQCVSRAGAIRLAAMCEVWKRMENAESARPTKDSTMADNSELTRPIIGIENRTAQEVFDIMADRIRRTPVTAEAGEVSEAEALAGYLREAQDILAEYIVPDSGISDTECVNRLLGVLDRRDVVLAARRVQPKQDAGSPIFGLAPDMSELSDAIETLEFNSKHIVAENDLDDALAMLDATKEVMRDVATQLRAALSRLTPPKQDDARDSTVGAAPVAAIDRAIERLRQLPSHAGRPAWDAVVKEELAASLASARADGVREGLEMAAKWHDDSGFTGQQHDVAAAAIRALINKDAGGPDAH